MARKKRRFDQAPPPSAAKDTGEKPRYQDPFQQTVGQRIESAGKMLEGKGRSILYGLGALVVLGIAIWIIYTWMGRSSAEAHTALGKAIETSQAVISETPPPAGSTERTFKTQRERAEASIAEFQAVVDKYGGEAGEKAQYFIAVNRLVIDRPVAIQELETLANSSGEVGSLSKFALAQTRAADGKLDEAAELYRQLADTAEPVLAKETINFALAEIYEKQDKKAEAVAVLFELVRSASEAKDADGNAIPLSSTAQEAREKLETLDPEKAKELPEPAPNLSGAPLGF